jgi:hypothetical protein
MQEPRAYAWIVPERVAVAERPGGCGRMHRRETRIEELEWWRDHGVVAIVSGMRTRHCLDDYAARGFEVRWHPLKDAEQAREAVVELAREVRTLLQTHEGAVLVHCDCANEWLAAIDAVLRMELGLARTSRTALRHAEADGLPVGSLATSIVARPATAAA